MAGPLQLVRQHPRGARKVQRYAWTWQQPAESAVKLNENVRNIAIIVVLAAAVDGITAGQDAAATAKQAISLAFLAAFALDRLAALPRTSDRALFAREPATDDPLRRRRAGDARPERLRPPHSDGLRHARLDRAAGRGGVRRLRRVPLVQGVLGRSSAPARPSAAEGGRPCGPAPIDAASATLLTPGRTGRGS